MEEGGVRMSSLVEELNGQWEGGGGIVGVGVMWRQRVACAWCR